MQSDSFNLSPPGEPTKKERESVCVKGPGEATHERSIRYGVPSEAQECPSEVAQGRVMIILQAKRFRSAS